ncbi:MAG TPA: lysophospholipid acyltransferase family protein [Verrucomicrobiae bacterium]|nr:lysophospholipid acyltransferase family protein [Verrucomicrobiae bacterium]
MTPLPIQGWTIADVNPTSVLVAAIILAVVLLPVLKWWLAWRPPQSSTGTTAGTPGADLPPAHRPSAFYTAGIWRAGQHIVRLLPHRLSAAIGGLISRMYFALHPRRRTIVVENLLPIVGNDLVAARAASRRLFWQFGTKVVGLLRYEAGVPPDYSSVDWSGRDTLLDAQSRGHGVLMVTVHLGDWEIGGALVADAGIKLVVLSQAEPSNGFTAMRQASRAQWGIETIVVGQDAFAFVDVIKRLQSGGVVALLVDRPPPSSAVTVTLFERPFCASISAAELARVTGCTILPVCVVRDRHGVCAHVLPEICYDRRALGTRDARIHLTQQIMRAFEPAIRQYRDQWYHFVPVWSHTD